MLKAHPVANIFPMMQDAEFAALVDDMREHGQREPIVMFDGLILDGRNRARACTELKIKPRVREWDRQGTAQDFVVSSNLHRRHLSDQQRAIIAARLAGLDKGQRADFASKKNEDAGNPASAPLTIKQAAKLMHVAPAAVASARIIIRRGTPDEVAALNRGDKVIHGIAKEIRQGVSAGKRAEARKAKPITKGKNPDRLERARMDADVWSNLSAGLMGLTSLPLPADVAKIVRANTARTRVAGERLSRALQWLTEFANEWSRHEDAA